MEEQQATKRRKLMLQGSAIVAAYIADKFCDNNCQNEGRLPAAKTIRQTNETDKFLSTMNERLFWRRYRMKKASFFQLLDLVGDHLPLDKTSLTGNKHKRGKTPNGPITQALCLSMAIYYFAGGDPLDIADRHMVGDGERLRLTGK
jgi:hypothetical protein